MRIHFQGLEIRTLSVRFRLGAPEFIESKFSAQDNAFRVVAWNSVDYHGFEWTTETADFRSAYY